VHGARAPGSNPNPTSAPERSTYRWQRSCTACTKPTTPHLAYRMQRQHGLLLRRRAAGGRAGRRPGAPGGHVCGPRRSGGGAAVRPARRRGRREQPGQARTGAARAAPCMRQAGLRCACVTGTACGSSRSASTTRLRPCGELRSCHDRSGGGCLLRAPRCTGCRARAGAVLQAGLRAWPAARGRARPACPAGRRWSSSCRDSGTNGSAACTASTNSSTTCRRRRARRCRRRTVRPASPHHARAALPRAALRRGAPRRRRRRLAADRRVCCACARSLRAPPSLPAACRGRGTGLGPQRARAACASSMHCCSTRRACLWSSRIR